MPTRKMSQNSLDNLKLGTPARDKSKIRVNYTLLPKTKEWLDKSGNASQRVDELVEKVLTGDLVSRSRLDDAIAKLELAQARIRELESK